MRELSLFSGAGGGLLASKHLLGWQTIGYVEINDYCQRVIARRIRDGLLDNAPIYGDIRTFIDSGCAELYRGVADVVTAGFPCQPFSQSGKRAGGGDDRNMWPATLQVLSVVKPAWALLENVSGLLTSGYFGTILGDLAELGIFARWGCLSGFIFGGPVESERLFIVATSDRQHGEEGMGVFKDRQRALQRGINQQMFGDLWLQTIDRNAGKHNGVANYMDRAHAVGNGQIPIMAATAWKILSGLNQ